jgi:LPXTG-motif cell wall-anchored protein
MQIVRVMRGRRRLISVIGAVTLVAASSAILLAPANAATTTTTAAATTTTTVPSSLPAGKVTVQATITFHLQQCTPAPCHASTITFTSSFVGTSDGNGNLTFPKSGITSAPVTLTIVVPVKVQLVATSDFTGTINTQTGLVTLTGSSETLLDIPDVNPSKCPLGPTVAHLSSANSGGVKYNATANTATVTDTTFVVPVITNPPASCPAALVDAITTALQLPISGADPRSIVVTMKVFPPGAVVPTTTTAPTTTTPTTAAPAATVTPSALPRTGGSDWPIAAFGLALVGGGLALASRRRGGLTRP